MNIDTKAEVFASKIYGSLSGGLEKMLERDTPITRETIKSNVIKAIRADYEGQPYFNDERMVEYVTDSLASSYIG